jgi:hypothetical protein
MTVPVNLSERDRWERLQAVQVLLSAVRMLIPELIPSPDQPLNDPTLLSLFCALVQKTGLDQVASQLEGLLSEWVASALDAAGEGDFQKILEAMEVLESEGEPNLFSVFQFWPVSQSWDDLAEDFVNGFTPMIIAFSLQGLISDFLSEETDLEEIDWTAPALAMSLHPYLHLFSAGWQDPVNIARFTLRALLATYFDYTDSPFLGEASREEAQTEFISWEDAPRLVEAYRQAEPVWEARPSAEDLSDPWYVFQETVKAFHLSEGGFEHDRDPEPG